MILFSFGPGVWWVALFVFLLSEKMGKSLLNERAREIVQWCSLRLIEIWVYRT